MDRSTFAAQQVLEQLKNRTDFYNRNQFQFKTSDEEADAIRKYCDQQKTTPNQFLRKLIQDFFNG